MARFTGRTAVVTGAAKEISMTSFGKIDPDYARHLLSCPPEEDGPILMVNYMKYRARADYGERGDQGISGREADDRYAPVDVLEKIGAAVAFFGDVEPGGEWDRIGIVCYPTRRSFMEMQNRPDFQQRYVHKVAGMERTFVCGTLPETAPAGAVVTGGRVVFEMVTPGTALQRTPTARLRVEGTIVGDGRRFATLGVSWIGDEPAGDASGADRVVAVVRGASIDRLAAYLQR
ncbi:MAG: hypothetical protein U0802_14150 [Candidatus Binatia bacterium]